MISLGFFYEIYGQKIGSNLRFRDFCDMKHV